MVLGTKAATGDILQIILDDASTMYRDFIRSVICFYSFEFLCIFVAYLVSSIFLSL